MPMYLVKHADRNEDSIGTQVLGGNKRSAAEAFLRDYLGDLENGPHSGVVRVWKSEDQEAPPTVYGWEADLEVPEGFDRDADDLDVEIKVAEQA